MWLALDPRAFGAAPRALSGAALMLVLGMISTEDLVGVLANPAPVTIGAMFILSAALVRTGALGISP